MVAAAHANQCMEGWLPLPAEQLKRHQESDINLVHLRQWLESGRRPECQEVSAFGPDLKAYHSQWGIVELHEGVDVPEMARPGCGTDLLQPLVPQKLRAQVLQVVHGSVGAGH